MRRLLLVRHAKAEIPTGLDIERRLAARGREAAPLIGAYLKDEHLLPDLALVSPAERTRETWSLMRASLGAVETREERRIYEASTEGLLGVVHGVEAGVRTLLIVGHNPSIGDLARRLAGHGDRYAFARLAQGFPTAALAVLDFAGERWDEAQAQGGRLDRFVTPGSLGGPEDP